MCGMQHAKLVSMVVLFIAGAARAGQETTPLHIGDGSQWRFSAKTWTEADGVIAPPDQRNLHSRAFYVHQGFDDFSAEFEYNPNYRELGHGGAGLILRAKDPNHFYAVYFPWGGQALRSKHFWASIVKVDGDGYLRSLKSAWVPGVASEVDRWFKVRVTAKGPNIDVWVDGRRAVSASEAAYQGGAVGLMGYGWYSFRDVRITGGAPTELPAWADKFDVPNHSIALKLLSDKSQSACIAPRGDVLLAAGNQLVRSKDGGRTWGPPETLPEFLGDVGDLGNCMFRAKDGRLLVQIFGGLKAGQGADATRLAVQGGEPPKILMSESVDNGATWKEPIAAKVESPWPQRPSILTPCGGMVQTDDGAMIRFAYGSLMKAGEANQGNVVTWGEYARLKAFAIRSTDGGKSWSKPIEIDQPAWPKQARGSIPGSLDFTEVTGVAIGNTVTALVRPVYSPYLWQCSSSDSGATWDNAVRTTFPGYGGPCMVRTRNGTLVCGHRMPHYSLNLSSDGGLNWDEGTVIDYPAWAIGTLLEVEPNVLLATYWNWTTKEPLLRSAFACIQTAWSR